MVWTFLMIACNKIAYYNVELDSFRNKDIADLGKA
jgi:hypothetical protein